MASKSDLFSQYSGLYLLILATQFMNVLTEPHKPVLEVTLTPPGPDVVKYVNSSLITACTPSYPELLVRWINPRGKVVSSMLTDRAHTEADGNGTVALMLSWISPKDAGVWKCEVPGIQQEVWQTFTLHVIRDIVFADTPIVQEGVQGNTGIILCEASGDPTPKLQWYHNAKRIETNSKKYREIADGLVIESLRRSDSGEYTCDAFQVSPHISNFKSKVIRFNVLHPPMFVNHRSIYYGYYYGTAEITCDVLADPPANIVWLSKRVSQDYYRINNDTINSSTLEIAVDDPAVFGKYTCLATNKYGTVERTFELRNGTKPSPPKRFIVKGVNNKTVHVEVEQEDDGTMNYVYESDMISGYRFQFITMASFKKYRQRKSDNLWYPEGEVTKNYSANNSYFIGNLSPRTIYKIRVATLNQAGPSDYSEDREFTTSKGRAVQIGNYLILMVVLAGAVKSVLGNI